MLFLFLFFFLLSSFFSFNCSFLFDRFFILFLLLRMFSFLLLPFLLSIFFRILLIISVLWRLYYTSHRIVDLFFLLSEVSLKLGLISLAWVTYLHLFLMVDFSQDGSTAYSLIQGRPLLLLSLPLLPSFTTIQRIRISWLHGRLAKVNRCRHLLKHLSSLLAECRISNFRSLFLPSLSSQLCKLWFALLRTKCVFYCAILPLKLLLIDLVFLTLLFVPALKFLFFLRFLFESLFYCPGPFF